MLSNQALGLGAWRLFLALLVGISHLWAGMLPGPAAYAVWGFFVLSGFLMAHVLTTKYGFQPAGLRAYARNRFLRIYPGFWVACLLGAAVLWWLSSRGIDARRLNPAFGMMRDWREWGFVSTLMPFFPRWNAPVPVANALSVEVGYYVLAVLLAQHRSTAWYALFFGLLVVGHHGLEPGSFGDRYAWFLPAAPAFALGALVCHYRHALSRFAAPRLSVAVWLAHCLAIFVRHDWPWTWGLYVSILVSAWVVVSLAGQRTGTLDSEMGELSYPFYLLHSTVGAALLAGFGYDRPLIFAVAGIGGTLAVSAVFVRLVDRPLTRVKSAPQLARSDH